MRILEILFIGILLSMNALCASIKGYVIDKKSLQPISSAFVFIDSGKIGTNTDNTGFFILKDISLGKHLLIIGSIGYVHFEDSIAIKESSQIVELTIKLEHAIVYIDTITEIENYHRYFNKYEREDILEIVLDSLSTKEYSSILIVYSTFYNKTDIPIYVIRDIECLRMIEPIIMNSNGEFIKRNSTFIDCLGEKEIPDSTDFFEIPPKGSLKYPQVFLYLHQFTNYPPDDYEIRIMYNYSRQETLPGFHNPTLGKQNFANQFYYYNMALRGKYESKNYLRFNNSKLIN